MRINKKHKTWGWLLFAIGLALLIATVYFFLDSGDGGLNDASAQRSSIVHIWVYLAVLAFPLLACALVLILGLRDDADRAPSDNAKK